MEHEDQEERTGAGMSEAASITALSSNETFQEQIHRYSETIGPGVPPEIVGALANQAQGMQSFEIYKADAHIKRPFIYEILDSQDWQQKVKAVVDYWVGVCIRLLSSTSLRLTSIILDRDKHTKGIKTSW